MVAKRLAAVCLILSWSYFIMHFISLLSKHYIFFRSRTREARMLLDGPCYKHGDIITGNFLDCQAALVILSSYVPSVFLALERTLHDIVVGFVRGALFELSHFLRLVGVMATLGLTAAAATSWTVQKASHAHFCRVQAGAMSEYARELNTTRLKIGPQSMRRIAEWGGEDDFEKVD
jgi:hypothetical protein